MRRVWVSLILALGLAPPLPGQVNIERLRRGPAAEGFVASAAANLTARTGNVRLTLLAAEGRVDYAGRRWTAFVVGSADVGWQGGQRFSNAGLVHVRTGRTLTGALAVEAFGQVDYDRARRLRSRSVLGAGLRAGLETSTAWRLTAGTGYMFERERLELADGATHPAATDVSRWTSYLSLHFREGERLSIASTFYAQPRLADLADVRALADARLGVQLVGSLSLTVTTRLRLDSRPPDGIADLDTTLTTGVSLVW